MKSCDVRAAAMTAFAQASSAHKEEECHCSNCQQQSSQQTFNPMDASTTMQPKGQVSPSSAIQSVPATCMTLATQMEAPFYCVACDGDFAVPTVILVDRHGHPAGYKPLLIDKNTGLATKWMIDHPRLYMKKSVKTAFSSSFNLWAMGNNFFATGVNASTFEATKNFNAAVSDHVVTATYPRPIGGWIVKLTAGDSAKTAMTCAFETLALVAWGDNTPLDRRLSIDIPLDIVTDGYVFLLFPYREPDLDERPQLMWGPPGENVQFKLLDVEPSITSQVTLITPGSDAAMRTARLLHYFNPRYAQINGGQ